MKLTNVASFFDRLPCKDAYTGKVVFKGQFDLFNEAVRDGLGAMRRVISTAPSVIVPPRKAIDTSDGKVWLIGESHPDYFNDRPIRVKYVLHQADGLATLQSFSEALTGTVSRSLYAARVWARSAKQVEISSELFDVLDLFFSSAEVVPNLSIIQLCGENYIVHETYATEGGFLAARVSELPNLRGTATFSKRVYDPITDSWAESTNDVPILRMRWQEHFRYFAAYSEKYEAGDQQIILSKVDVTRVDAGDILTVEGQNYRVVVAYDEGSVWSIHGRPS